MSTIEYEIMVVVSIDSSFLHSFYQVRVGLPLVYDVYL